MDGDVGVDVVDFSKLKVPELKRELKARGLSSSGNKNELLERLQNAIKTKNDNGDASLVESVDELEEDLLNDDDDEHLDSTDSVLADIDGTLDVPQVTATSIKVQKRAAEEVNLADSEQPKTKKLVLNRTTSAVGDVQATNGSNDKNLVTSESNDSENKSEKKVIKFSDMGAKERLELRAKKFGGDVSTDVKKAARAERFGTSSITNSTGKISLANTTTNIDALKQRAERFGGSVSSVMSKMEEQERLEKRKARFGVVTNSNGVTSQDDKAKLRLERFKQR